MKQSVIIPIFTLAASLAQAETLTLYAPDYFGSEWGPGPALEAGFEAECGCDLDIVTGDVLSRLMLEGAQSPADAVIGLSELDRARARALMAPHGQDLTALTLPVAWTDAQFLPFNWSHLAFVYDSARLDDVPGSLMALAASDIQVTMPDPRSGPTGRAALVWAREALGAEGAAQFWTEMADNVLTYTPGWSESYGLFTAGEVAMTLSFTTSPAYHIAAEEDDSIKAALFEEGHPLFVELAGITAHTDQPALAAELMAYLISERFQTVVFEANWSYPAALPRADWPALFRSLAWPDTSLFYSDDVTPDRLRDWVEGWRQAVSQ